MMTEQQILAYLERTASKHVGVNHFKPRGFSEIDFKEIGVKQLGDLLLEVFLRGVAVGEQKK